MRDTSSPSLKGAAHSLVHITTDPWRLAAYVWFIALGALACATFRDVGLTWDEPLQLKQGESVLAWYHSHHHARHAYGPLPHYGGLFEAFAQLVVRIAPFRAVETRHLLTSLIALLGIVGAWKIATRLGGTRTGFMAALLLSTTPVWIGHGLFNPKDIPFATAVAFAIYALVRVWTEPRALSWATALIGGLATGAALGIRPSGWFVALYVLSALFMRLWFDARRESTAYVRALARALTQAAPKLAAIAALSYAGMMVAWPWAQYAPLSRPLRAVHEAMHFGWHGKVLFRGAYLPANGLPASYLPTWFAITLPEAYALGALCGAALLLYRLRNARAWHSARSLAAWHVFATAALPVLAAILMHPVLYDGYRHLLFVIPPLAVCCALGISELAAVRELSTSVRGAVLAMFFALCALAGYDMLNLHPYEYTYFNRISGGLQRAVGRYETDYWGASYKEGMDWLAARAERVNGRPLTVASCNVLPELKSYVAASSQAAEHLRVVDRLNEADLFLSTTRFNCYRIRGRILHVVERQGAPLLYVIARSPAAMKIASDAPALLRMRPRY